MSAQTCFVLIAAPSISGSNTVEQEAGTKKICQAQDKSQFICLVNLFGVMIEQLCCVIIVWLVFQKEAVCDILL